MIGSKSLVCLVALAALCWFIMFFPPLKSERYFWFQMVVSTALLAGSALRLASSDIKNQLTNWFEEVPIGVFAAAVLYFVFYGGYYLSTALFSGAKVGVTAVYSTRIQASPLVIGMLLFFWIGPCEEVFWRGFVQRKLAAKFGPWRGYVYASSLYTLVHIWSGNPMLIIAALFCGFFWGGLYLWRKRLTACLLSHALWDLSIFVLFPVVARAA